MSYDYIDETTEMITPWKPPPSRVVIDGSRHVDATNFTKLEDTAKRPLPKQRRHWSLIVRGLVVLDVLLVCAVLGTYYRQASEKPTAFVGASVPGSVPTTELVTTTVHVTVPSTAQRTTTATTAAPTTVTTVAQTTVCKP